MAKIIDATISIQKFQYMRKLHEANNKVLTMHHQYQLKLQPILLLLYDVYMLGIILINIICFVFVFVFVFLK